MKFATRKNGTRDGELLLISSDASRALSLAALAPNLQALLDHWDALLPHLREKATALEAGDANAIATPWSELHSPLPRAYEWVDGSAFIHHVKLVRRARKAELPPTLNTDPLVYQGGSGVFLAPTDPITFPTDAWGIDFESEVAIVLGDVPRGTKASEVAPYVRLVMLVNDTTLRNLIPDELAKGFGFFVSKPSTTFSPLALTPDELGEAWSGGRLHLPLRTTLNGTLFGDPNAGPEMHFSFFELVEHICRTRALTAGTIVGSGTISNEDPARGSSCLVERRTLETLADGAPKTPYMTFGDSVEIAMFDTAGRNLFGTISQTVVKSDR